MRVGGHSDADSSWYVPEAEIQRWQKRDPILLYESRLEAAGLLTNADRAETEDRVRAILTRELEVALSGPEPDGKSTLEGVYGD